MITRKALEWELVGSNVNDTESIWVGPSTSGELSEEISETSQIRKAHSPLAQRASSHYFHTDTPRHPAYRGFGWCETLVASLRRSFTHYFPGWSCGCWVYFPATWVCFLRSQNGYEASYVVLGRAAPRCFRQRCSQLWVSVAEDIFYRVWTGRSLMGYEHSGV